jgi:predicted phage terminase large subunit-like protein
VDGTYFSNGAGDRMNPALRRRVEAMLQGAPQSLTDAQLAARDISLRDFVRWAWQIIEPGTPLVWNWHLDAICEHVEALLRGTLGKQNLMVLVPPGFAKSTVVSVCAPAWMWITQPSWRAMLASGNERVSTRDSLKRRNLIDSGPYRRAFTPQWRLSPDANQKTRYENTVRGFHQALSSGQRVTGDRADHLSIDDPSDAATIHSEAEREAVERWFFEAFANRLANMQTGTRSLIMQRLHSIDLAGLIIEREGNSWEVVTVPQEWDEKRRIVTSLGWTDPRTQDGELAFPERYPGHVIEAERVRLGRSAFASQHQQEPFDAAGEIFRPDAINLWPAGIPMPLFTRVIESIDTAFSIKTTADYSVILELGEFDRGVMVMSCLRQRLEYPQLKEAAVHLASKGGVSAVLIEDKASGQSLVQDLRQSTRLPVIPIKVDTDKISRAHVIVPSVEAGRIFAPADAPWLQDFLKELAAFPKGAHDDIVDAFTQGVSYLLLRSLDGVLIQPKLIRAAVGAAERLGIKTSDSRDGALYVSEGSSKNAFAVRDGIELTYLQSWPGDEDASLHQTVLRAFAICDELNLDGFTFSVEGAGSGVHAAAEKIREARAAAGLRRIEDHGFQPSGSIPTPSATKGKKASGAVNESPYADLGSRAFWRLRQRFEATYNAIEGLPYEADDLISLSPNVENISILMAEVASMNYLVNSDGKTEVDLYPKGMQPRGLAIAAMMAFSPDSLAYTIALWGRLGQ